MKTRRSAATSYHTHDHDNEEEGVGDDDDEKDEAYLIFVIFFSQAKFLENKIYTEKRQFFA